MTEAMALEFPRLQHRVRRIRRFTWLRNLITESKITRLGSRMTPTAASESYGSTGGLSSCKGHLFTCTVARAVRVTTHALKIYLNHKISPLFSKICEHFCCRRQSSVWVLRDNEIWQLVSRDEEGPWTFVMLGVKLRKEGKCMLSSSILTLLGLCHEKVCRTTCASEIFFILRET
jgi:hypothetical protein